jgi:hypothetical protein
MNSFPNTEDMRRTAPRLRTDRAKQAIALKPWITIPELDRFGHWRSGSPLKNKGILPVLG